MWEITSSPLHTEELTSKCSHLRDAEEQGDTGAASPLQQLCLQAHTAHLEMGPLQKALAQTLVLLKQP